MASDIILFLREDLLKTDAIVLEAEGYDEAAQEDFELYDREEDESDLMIDVHRDTGDVLQIVLEEFTSGTELAVWMLREYPLPWLFNLPSLRIREKPLEDVLLAVWKKFKNVKLTGD